MGWHLYFHLFERIKSAQFHFRSVILCCALFFSLTYGQYQRYQFSHLTVNDGLSQNTINGIVQDTLGFIWIATPDGINKFDGYSIKQYRRNSTGQNKLPDNFIRCLTKAENGNIWIGTESGIAVELDPILETFENIGNITDGYPIHTILVLKDEIWFGSWGAGIFIYNLEEKTIVHFNTLVEGGSTILDPFISDIKLMADGSIWVTTHNAGIMHITRTESQLYSVRNFIHDPENDESLSNDEVNTVFQDSDGVIWVGTITALDRYDNDIDRFEHFSLEIPDKLFSVNALVEIEKDKLLLSLQNGGLVFFNSSNGRLIQYTNDPTDPNSLSYDAINTIFKDRSGEIWIGTWGRGLDHFTPNSIFKHYSYRADEENSISHPSVRSILKTQNNLWVGSYGGLDRFDRSGRLIRRYTPHNSDLSNINVYALYQEKDILWIGTEGGGLNQLNLSTGGITCFVHKEKQYSGNNFIFSMAAKDDRYVWIGSHEGIEIFDRKEQLFIPLVDQKLYPAELSTQTVHALLFDDENNLWVGTDDRGVYKMTVDGTHIESVTQVSTQSKKAALNNDRIKCIIQDASGRIWIGSSGGGITILSEDNIAYITESDGLANDVVYGIVEDKKHNIWCSTNQGISRFNPSTNIFTNFDHQYGLQSDEFNTGAFYQDEDGNIYFGGINGITVFDPEKYRNTTPIRSPIMTQLFLSNKVVNPGDKIEGKEILKTPLYSTPQMSLLPNIDQITFEFSDMTYSHPKKIRYSYRIKGLSDQWNETDGLRNFAIYNHLPAGNFIFQVRYKLRHNQEFGPSRSLEITIPPPFYFTWWAMTFYITLLIGVLFALFRYQRNKHEKELRRQQELVRNLKRIDALKLETIKNQEKYQKLFQNSMDAIFIANGNGEFIDFNPSWRSLFRMDIDSKEKNSIFNLFADENEKSRFRELVLQAESIKDFEATLLSSDNNPLTCLITGSALKDHHHNIVSIQGIVRDITYEKQAQEEIKRLSRGVDAAGESFIMTDLDEKILYANPSFTALTGYSAEEVIGLTPRLLKSGKHPREFYVNMWEQLISGKRWTGEITNKRKDESFYNATLTITPVKDESGQVTGYIAIHSDITKRKEMEDALRSSEKKYKYLAQQLMTIQDAERERISRDIHDSLGQSLATLAVQTDLNINSLEEIAPSISNDMNKTKSLIRDAIEECRRLSFELNPLSLQRLGLVQALNELTNNIIERSELEIAFNAPINMLAAKSEIEIAIYRVVQEAFSNIFKHANAKQVVVNLSTHQNRILLEIIDDGVGFSFNKDLDGDRLMGGFGLLNMQERIANCGGEFLLNSTPGKGTEIRISIPV